MGEQLRKPFTKRISFENYAGSIISPVVFEVPHSGLTLPDHVLHSCPTENLRFLEDPYVHFLVDRAYNFHITTFINNIHRTVVDMNRDPDEINPADVKDGWNKPYRVTPYTKSGHGVIPIRLGGTHRLTEIYNRHARPSSYEIERRLNWYYHPYHKLLKSELDRVYKRNGLSIHMDMHSMSRKAPFKPERPDICIGTLNETSSHPLLDNFIKTFFKNEGLSVKFNSPFSGTTIIRNTHEPENARYSIQIEIARDLYMIPNSHKLSSNNAMKMKTVMTRFAEQLNLYACKHATVLRQGYSPNTPSHTSRKAPSRGPNSP